MGHKEFGSFVITDCISAVNNKGRKLREVTWSSVLLPCKYFCDCTLLSGECVCLFLGKKNVYDLSRSVVLRMGVSVKDGPGSSVTLG
jgi:hypothetical protein